MLSFFRKKTNAVPEWADFFDEKEYTRFIQEIEQYFNSRNIPHRLNNGMIELDENDVFEFGNMGLMNVAQVCKQADKKEYREIINDHFNTMIRTRQFQKEFDAISHDFEQIKQFIGVRLYNSDYIAHLGKELTIGKEFAGDIYAMVVFDFPDSVSNVKLEQMEAWNKTPQELFELGVANIKLNYQSSITKEPVGEESIWFVHGEHFFTPNVVFELEERKELVGSKGALIGLPHRHSALIYPIESMEVVSMINTLIPIIYGMHNEGPGSLSDQLFWYKDGTFTQLPYEIGEQNIRFYPPENFVEFLDEAAGEGPSLN